MKTAAQLGGASCHRHAAAYLVTYSYGREQSLAVGRAAMAYQRICGGYRFRTRVDDADPVKVVHFKAMDQRAVGQGRACARNLRAVTPEKSPLARA